MATTPCEQALQEGSGEDERRHGICEPRRMGWTDHRELVRLLAVGMVAARHEITLVGETRGAQRRRQPT